jgi:hypothetical protein
MQGESGDAGGMFFSFSEDPSFTHLLDLMKPEKIHGTCLQKTEAIG